MTDRITPEKQRRAAMLVKLLSARCECGWPGKRDCYHYTPDMAAWCWPCLARWAGRPDAARFVAPKDDLS